MNLILPGIFKPLSEKSVEGLNVFEAKSFNRHSVVLQEWAAPESSRAQKYIAPEAMGWKMSSELAAGIGPGTVLEIDRLPENVELISDTIDTGRREGWVSNGPSLRFAI